MQQEGFKPVAFFSHSATNQRTYIHMWDKPCTVIRKDPTMKCRWFVLGCESL